MNLEPPIRIIGCGSPQGDDSVAWRVVGSLQAEAPPEVELHTVTSGSRLLDFLDGEGTLVLIDAVRSGQPPGTVHRLSWPDKCVQTVLPGSTHGLSSAEALQLAETTGMLSPKVLIFAIEIDRLNPLAGLSPAVESAIPQLVKQVLEMLPRGNDAAN